MAIWIFGGVLVPKNETKLLFRRSALLRVLRVVLLLLSRVRAAIGSDYDNDGLLGHHGHHLYGHVVVVVGRPPTELW